MELITNTIETKEQIKAFRTIRLIEWHLSKIKRNNCKISNIDLKDLLKIEELLKNIELFDTEGVKK